MKAWFFKFHGANKAVASTIKSDANLGELYDGNAMTSFVLLAKTAEHKNSVCGIDIHPNFQVYYWTDKQIEYYKIDNEKFYGVTMTFNATWSFFKALRLPDGTPITKTLFLYAGLIPANNNIKSVPVVLMISTRMIKKQCNLASKMAKWWNPFTTWSNNII